MEQTRRPSNKESSDQAPELVGLVELQKFLEEELAAMGGTDIGERGFRPLTDGLGLESPKERTGFTTAPTPIPMAPPVLPVRPEFKLKPEYQTELKKELRHSVASVLSDERPLFEPSIPLVPPMPMPQELLEAPVAPEFLGPEPERLIKKPPELPSPSALRRLCAAILDQIFVLTIVAIALVLTSNSMTASASGVSSKVLEHLRVPGMLRFATLEFTAIWILYLTICLGGAGRTFGMWVWNINVAFGLEEDDSRFPRTVMRIFWSFFFYALIVPMLVLAIRVKGRNLLDLLSGTSLYIPSAE